MLNQCYIMSLGVDMFKKIKKYVFIFVFLIVTFLSTLFVLSFFKNQKKNNTSVFIKEKYYITQLNQIYSKKEEYIGKTISLEGLFHIDYINGSAYCMVYRNTPGCCGNDGIAGFDVVFDGQKPKDGSWVSVTGKLEEVTHENKKYLQLRLTNIEIKNKPGKTFVTN